MGSNYSKNTELYGHEDGFCDNCGDEVSEDFVLTNAYGEQLCDECWDEYINSEEGLVEYVIGLANTDYDITDFDDNELLNMVSSWRSHRAELKLPQSEIARIEADAATMGLDFNPVDEDGFNIFEKYDSRQKSLKEEVEDDAEDDVENLSPEMQRLYDEIMDDIGYLYGIGESVGDYENEYPILDKFIRKHLLNKEFKEAYDTIVGGSDHADYDYVGAVVLKLDSGVIILGDSETTPWYLFIPELLDRMEKGLNGKVEIIGHYSLGTARMDSSIFPGTNLKVYQNHSNIAKDSSGLLTGYAEFKNMDLLNQFLADSFGGICDITPKTDKFPAFYKVVKGAGNYPAAVIWNTIGSFDVN